MFEIASSCSSLTTICHVIEAGSPIQTDSAVQAGVQIICTDRSQDLVLEGI